MPAAMRGAQTASRGRATTRAYIDGAARHDPEDVLEEERVQLNDERECDHGHDVGEALDVLEHVPVEARPRVRRELSQGARHLVRHARQIAQARPIILPRVQVPAKRNAAVVSWAPRRGKCHQAGQERQTRRRKRVGGNACGSHGGSLGHRTPWYERPRTA
jgi:hypothetical protein